MRNFLTMAMLVALLASSAALAGPYSLGAGGDPGPPDPAAPPDPGVPGFVGDNGDGVTTAPNYVNPEFIGWATGYVNYLPAPGVLGGNPETGQDHTQPSRALGPVTGDLNDIVSLGDLYDPTSPPQAWEQVPEPGWIGIDPPGEITVTFDLPIRDGPGPDFAVFENGYFPGGLTYLFAELAYVEVSSNGVDFVRFESDSLTPQPPDPLPPYDCNRHLTINPTDVYNLAGKHANSGIHSWGTPFDLDQFADDPDVLALVDLQQIKYVKIVDVPGSGYYLDAHGDPIYDAWWTSFSGGFDLEALGVLNEMPDFDGDGDVDGDDFDILRDNLGSTDLYYDLDNDGDADPGDLNYMIANNLQWVNGALSGYGTAPGDFNLDGVVDNTDLTRLATYYGPPPPGECWGWADGNANFDDTIDNTDLTILATYYGYSAPGLTPVPEPASLSLLAAGALALVRRRRE